MALPPCFNSVEGVLSETLSTDAKILRFPSAVAETPIAAPAAGAPSAFQRLAAVRRRRPERAASPETPPATTAEPGHRPSVSQLVTWLLNLRKGGVGFLYWNAAKLPIEVALVRAARLDDGAIVDVVGHRMLVVEPIRPLLAPVAGQPTEGVLS